MDARLPCPVPSPRTCSNSWPLSSWCHPTISSTVAFSSSCTHSFPASGPFQWVSSLHQVGKVLKLQLWHHQNTEKHSNSLSGLIHEYVPSPSSTALKKWKTWLILYCLHYIRVLLRIIKLDCIHFIVLKSVNTKGNQSWIFTGRTDAEAEAPILWPPDAKSWLIRKDPDAGKDWRQKEKGEAEDEIVR